MNLNKLQNLRDNTFIDINNSKGLDVKSEVFELLENNKIYIDLEGVENENKLLDSLYKELIKIDKIKDILNYYNITKNKFWIMDFDHISDELEVAELKIVFDNIDKIPLEIQETLNSLLSIRERKIIYFLVWNLENYTFLTWIEGIHLREWPWYDYIII